ncbi:MAG: nucleotidyltransferase domain-containing protein [Holophagaceae bacterium]|nr:nucleotidyltransferase domain-containing protein [Holophagaceae bacterium]
MADDINTITMLAKKYVDDVCASMPVEKAVLFGSHIKGTANENSDIDICFFITKFSKKNYLKIMLKLYEIRRPYKKIYFEPHLFSITDIDKNNMFINEILETGTNLI